jgi:hypothetical protein
MERTLKKLIKIFAIKKLVLPRNAGGMFHQMQKISYLTA